MTPFASPPSVLPRQPITSVDHPLYPETVYAGILGKLIGVYLGRPVENWSYEAIADMFGEITYYVHEQRGRRLIITDDDISGTLTFLRALEDYQFSPDLTPAQVGQTWLNYLIEEKTILWWGGLGNSTEHTAYLRLKKGISAPQSGSAALNSQIISEQIGAQIFIDGWGLIFPGQPDKAADFARRAASVSHDGEAIYGAQVVASLVSAAFCEADLERLIEMALQQIPPDSTVRRLVDDVREWHLRSPDWRSTLGQIHANYGYDKFRGQCHLIPNHALIILALLYGQGDFDESMKIVNTAGWDTDCNSGNVGAILGVRNGLAGFTAQDWRGPVADRLYLPSADPGRSITDAARESLAVINAGRQLHRLPPLVPKGGERFHFAFAGSVQGFRCHSPQSGRAAHAQDEDAGAPYALRLTYTGGEPARFSTPTFIPPDTKDMVTGYVLVACPTLYSGHHVVANLSASLTGARGRMFLSHYNAQDESTRIDGPAFELTGGQTAGLTWDIPDTGGYPIHEIGFELDAGEILLDTLDWRNIPRTSWPAVEGTMWARGWANALNRFSPARDKYEYLAQNEGTGFLAQGHREWRNYRVSARITPRMAESGGLAVRYQGTRRYYAFCFATPGEVKFTKVLDGEQDLARVSYPWKPFNDYEVAIDVEDNRFRVTVNGSLILQVEDEGQVLESGGFAFTVTAGCMGAGTPHLEPL